MSNIAKENAEIKARSQALEEEKTVYIIYSTYI
jgi:hypothetical protein